MINRKDQTEFALKCITDASNQFDDDHDYDDDEGENSGPKIDVVVVAGLPKVVSQQNILSI